MPKLNMYRSLHTTVIGPEGKPLEIQVRTREMHETAELGIAAHWLYKSGRKDRQGRGRAARLAEAAHGLAAGRDRSGRVHADVPRPTSTPTRSTSSRRRARSSRLPAGSTPIDFAYAVHTDVGHRTVGAKVNGRIVPLHYQLEERRLRRDPDVEAARSRALARLALDRRLLARAEQDPPVVEPRDARGHGAARPRVARAGAEAAQPAVPEDRRLAAARGRDPGDELQEGRGLLPRARLREAAGRRRSSTKVLHKLKTTEVAEEETLPLKPKARNTVASQTVGITVPGVEDVLVRLGEVLQPRARRRDLRLHLARQGDHDPPRGLPERQGAAPQPGALHRRRMGRRGDAELPRADRRRLAGIGRACSRTSPARSPSTARTSSSTRGHVDDQMAKNWYVAEIGDVKALRALLNSLRNIESVFDAYRVTPS